ncbi:MAG: DUF1036 domain-containing protein [Phascolarctobacterium sp.]|nr:DUF1036 domain-containing protein [Phascolarctobacterium sp.]
MKCFKKVMFGLMMVVSLCAFIPKAEATQLYVSNNRNGSTLYVAVLYLMDKGSNTWFAKGWFSVEPYSARSLYFNHAQGNTLWIHAYNKNYEWGGDRYFYVVHEAFHYDTHYPNALQGTNKRKVGFSPLYKDEYGIVNFFAE